MKNASDVENPGSGLAGIFDVHFYEKRSHKGNRFYLRQLKNIQINTNILFTQTHLQ